MRARRTDANHQTIAGYFERLGCFVHSTNGDWDLTVSKFGTVKLIEIKDPNKPPSATRLTERSQKLVNAGLPIVRVETMDDVIAVVRSMRRGG